MLNVILIICEQAEQGGGTPEVWIWTSVFIFWVELHEDSHRERFGGEEEQSG